ncbi:MAG: hypothetical protein IBJ15_05005 [Alphaproteobacteria bacterium]|nr:hypothetical protein [Alphaproteobacteria bacterium]
MASHKPQQDGQLALIQPPSRTPDAEPGPATYAAIDQLRRAGYRVLRGAAGQHRVQEPARGETGGRERVWDDRTLRRVADGLPRAERAPPQERAGQGRGASTSTMPVREAGLFDAPAGTTAQTLRVAIVGSAGRTDDGPRIAADPAIWERMLAKARTLIYRIRERSDRSSADIQLVSGGAAFADHVAVRLFLDGDAGKLKLHLPGPFDAQAGGFAGKPSGDVATLIRYHADFKRRCGVDVAADLLQAWRRGATIETHAGFAARNAAVAREADAMIAFTFAPARGAAIAKFEPGEAGHSDPVAAGLKSGGTAKTWRLCQAPLKIHADLAALERRGKKP